MVCLWMCVGPAECDVADKFSGVVKCQSSSSACPVSLSCSSSHSGLYSMCYFCF